MSKRHVGLRRLFLLSGGDEISGGQGCDDDRDGRQKAVFHAATIEPVESGEM